MLRPTRTRQNPTASSANSIPVTEAHFAMLKVINMANISPNGPGGPKTISVPISSS